MSEATLLPAFIALFGVVAALFLVGFVITPVSRKSSLTDGLDDLDDFSDLVELEVGIPASEARVVERVSLPRHFAALRAPREVDHDDEPTERIPVVTPSGREDRQRVRHPARHEVRRPVRHEDPATEPLTVEFPATPLSRNGFHVGRGRRLHPIVNGAPVPDVLAKFGITARSPARRNRHYREDPEDTDAFERDSRRDGRH
jgi:hypothetical protein